MTVPVLAVVPSPDLVPKGWTILQPEETVPPLWTARPAAVPAQPPTPAPATSRKRPKQDETVFTVDEPVPDGVGARVTGSPVYADQRKYLRKAPDARQVAAVIDALAGAGGHLSAAAVGAAAAAAGGRAPRDADLFITALQRLLNVEGYPVLGLIDNGGTVKLEAELLREQFGVDG